LVEAAAPEPETTGTTAQGGTTSKNPIAS